MSGRGPGSQDSGDRMAQVTGAAHTARARWHRARFGMIGSEPFEARRPVARTYVATWGTVGALLLTLAGSVPAGGAVMLACLLVGVPKRWTWANDRLGSGLWVLGLAVVAAGEIAWATGGTAARTTLSHHHNPGLAMALVLIGGFVSLFGYFRRWGTQGNVMYSQRQSQRGDPVAQQVGLEQARRDGYGRKQAPAAGESDTIAALDEAYRREHPNG